MKEKIPFGLLLLSILIKFSWFYQQTSVTSHYLVIVLITFVIYSGIVLLMIKKPWLAITTSLIISLILEGEVLYFRYFNKLLSFSNLSQAKFVNSVTNVMLSLIHFQDLVLVIDIALIAVMIFKKHQGFEIKHKYVTVAMMIAVAPCLTLAAFGNDFGISVMNQEFFMYHTKDGIEVYQQGQSEEMPLEAPVPIESVVVETKDEKAFRGLFQDKNIITIQVESLQDMMLQRTYNGQEITPFLNSLIGEDSFYFSSYYQQLGRGNTSDSEFSTHNSLYPSMDGISYERYKDTTFRGLPVLLKERGYETVAFHGNEGAFWGREAAYTQQGFNTFYSSEKLMMDEIIGMGLSDASLFKQGVEILKGVEEPFYSFFVTLSNHNPYVLPEEMITFEVPEHVKGSLFGHYVESVRYTDEALAQFFGDLERAGLLENTVVILYGDHHGIACMDSNHRKQVSAFLGYDYDFDEMMNIPLIIYAKGSGVNETSDEVFDQQDLLPTMVNLLGIDEELNMMGQDMLNTDDYFVLFQTYMVKGSFIRDDIVFEMSRDGIFENSRAYNRKTKEPVEVSLCKKGYERAIYEIEKSRYILETNQVVKQPQ